MDVIIESTVAQEKEVLFQRWQKKNPDTKVDPEQKKEEEFASKFYRGGTKIVGVSDEDLQRHLSAKQKKAE